MNREALAKKLGYLADVVVANPRWCNETLDVAVLGMLLYGYALAVGRMAMMLDQDDIDAATLRCLTENVGAATKWSAGLVDDARASAFDKSHHPGNFELIGVGHSYFGVEDLAPIVDNVFANIASVRRKAGLDRA